MGIAQSVASLNELGVAGCGPDDQKHFGGFDGSHEGGSDREFKTIAEDYDASQFVKDNKKIIDAIFNGALKGLNAKSSASSPEAKVAWMIEHGPNKDKGKSIAPNQTKQRQMCVSFANSINKAYGRKVVDPSAPTQVICNGVSNILASLGAGIHKQFVGVATSAEKTLQDIRTLKDALSMTYNRLHNDAVGSSDDVLSSKVSGMVQLHDALMTELDQRIQVLANLVSVTLKDGDRDIVDVLLNDDDFRGLIVGLDQTKDGKVSGKMLGEWMMGVNNISQVALQVNKALKQIGLANSKYKGMSKLSEIKTAADRLLQSKPKDKLTMNYLRQFYAAVDTLSRNHGLHSEITSYLTKHKVGGYDGPYDGAPYTGSFEGGSEHNGGRLSLKKKIAKHTTGKRAIVKAFREKSDIYFKRILQSVVDMSKGLGSTIPITYQLDRFINVFTELEPVSNKTGIEYALTGYSKHATAIAERTKFIGALRAINHALEPLLSGRGGSSFGTIKTNVDAILKLIEFYSQQFNVFEEPKVERYGITEGAGEYNGASEASGHVGGAGDFKASSTIQRAISSLHHYYNVAKMKANLSKVAEEVKGYNKEYRTILGESMGALVNEAEDEYEALVKKFGTDSTDVGRVPYKSRFEAVAKSRDSEISKYNKEEVLAFARRRANGKQSLYKALQAIDMYLQHFTDRVAKDPDNIREIGKILESAEAIADWFNDTSGDYIAGVFDAFPWAADPNGKPMYNTRLAPRLEALTKVINSGASGQHYYQTLYDLYETDEKGVAQGVGIPFLPVDPKRGNQISKFMAKTYDKVYALKNLISLFAFLGDKFGGESIGSKVFLSPHQIYQEMISYMTASSLNMGFNRSNDKDFNLVRSRSSLTTHESNSNVFERGDDNNLSTKKNSIGIGVQASAVTEKVIDSRDTLWGDGNNDVNKSLAVLQTNYGVTMAPVGDSTLITNILDTKAFEKTNKLFAHAVKAMAAKIFTVAGMYNIMNHKTAPVPVLSTTRVILGGLDLYNTPTIHDEALELYVRLPLLGEFYHEIFDFKTKERVAGSDTQNWLVSMVPEVDSYWSGFIRTVFEHPSRASASYTDNQTKRIINEINGIWQRYKGKASGSDMVMRIITDFIAEVNRRYGVMHTDEMNEYIQFDEIERKRMYTSKDIEDYDILDEDRVGTGVAPSDMYSKINRSNRSKNKYEDWHYNLVCKFRNKIDTRIRGVVSQLSKGDQAIPRLTRQLMFTRESLAAAKSNDEKYKIVMRTIQGLDQLSKKGEDALVMFHEIVVAPLAILHRVYTTLFYFTQTIMGLDIGTAYDSLEKAFRLDDLKADINGATYNGGAYNALDSKQQAAAHPLGTDKVLKRIRQSNKFMSNIIKHAANALYWSNERNEFDETKGDQGLFDRRNMETNYQSSIQLQPLTVLTDHVDKDNSTLCRYAFDWDFIFYHLTGAVFGVTADMGDLVTFRPHGNSMQFDASKLINKCENLMASVRSNMDKLRGSIDANVIAKYENIDTVGSVNWLQQHMMDGLFGSRDSLNIARCSKVITDAYRLFATEWPSYMGNITQPSTPPTLAVLGIVNKPRRWSFDYPMSMLTHYNSYTMDSGYAAFDAQHRVVYQPDAAKTMHQFMHTDYMKTTPTDNDRLADLYLDPPSMSGGQRESASDNMLTRVNIYLDGEYFDRLRGDYHHETRVAADSKTPHVATNTDTGMGLMLKFNELLNKYMNQFMDTGSSRLYSKVLNGFVGGTHHNAIMSGHCWPDFIKQDDSLVCKRVAEIWIKKRLVGAGYAANDDAKNGMNEVSDLDKKHMDKMLATWIEQKFVDEAKGEIKLVHAEAETKIAGATTAGDSDAEKGKSWNDDRNDETKLNTINKMTGGTAALQKYKAVIKVGLALLTLENMGTDILVNNGFSRDSKFPTKYGDPQGIIFSSLGRKLKIMFSETTSGSNSKRWLHENIADVSDGMKENYKANMPLFRKWFSIIAKKASMLKSFIDLGVSCERFGFVGVANNMKINKDEVKDIPLFITSVAYGREHKDNNGAPIDISAHDWIAGTGANQQKEIWVQKAMFDKKKRQISYRMGYNIVLGANQARVYYGSLCDNIVSACTSLVGCIDKVMSEVNDSPKFLELHGTSIATYRSMHNELPLMPFSTTVGQLVKERPNENIGLNGAKVMGNVTGSKIVKRPPNLAYPFYRSQHEMFQFNYGNRLVLHDFNSKPVLEHFPGMKDILDRYNAVAISSKKMDSSVFSTQLSDLACMSRYVFDTSLISSMLGGSKLVVDITRGDTRASDDVLLYQTKEQLHSAIKLTSESDRMFAMQQLVSGVSGTVSKTTLDRADAVVVNVLDMNVMPINVHALRKEVPLVNIYNYSCTFEQFLRDSLNLKNGGALNRVEDTHDMMYKLCIHPYAQVDPVEYRLYLSRLIRGNSTIDVEGRPRFVTDQLWNKALLNTVDEDNEFKRDIARGRGVSEEKSKIAQDQLEIKRYTDAVFDDDMWVLNNNVSNITSLINANFQGRPNAVAKLMQQMKTKYRFNATTEKGRMYRDALHDAMEKWLMSYGAINIDANGYITGSVQPNEKIFKANVSAGGTNDWGGGASDQECVNAIKVKNPVNGKEVEVVKTSDDIAGNSFSHWWYTRVADPVLAHMNVDPFDDTNEQKNDQYLTWTDSKGKLQKKGLNKTHIPTNLGNIGMNMRFNTTFARNLMFFSNIQRMVRMKIRDEVFKTPYPVLTSTAIAGPGLTEQSLEATAGLNID